MLLSKTESVAYEFGSNKGMIQYMFPPGKQPDTEEDSIALGFITTKSDAVLLRVESSTTQDYMELEIVIYILIRNYFIYRFIFTEQTLERNAFISFLFFAFIFILMLYSNNRSKEIYSWCTMSDHMTFHLVKLALR